MRHPSRYMITSNATRDEDSDRVFEALGPRPRGSSIRDMVFRVATTQMQTSQASRDRDDAEPNAFVRLHSLLAREGPQPLFSHSHALGMHYLQGREDPSNAAVSRPMVPWESDATRYDASRSQPRPSTRRGRSEHSLSQSSLQYGLLLHQFHATVFLVLSCVFTGVPSAMMSAQQPFTNYDVISCNDLQDFNAVLVQLACLEPDLEAKLCTG